MMSSFIHNYGHRISEGNYQSLHGITTSSIMHAQHSYCTVQLVHFKKKDQQVLPYYPATLLPCQPTLPYYPTTLLPCYLSLLALPTIPLYPTLLPYYPAIATPTTLPCYPTTLPYYPTLLPYPNYPTLLPYYPTLLPYYPKVLTFLYIRFGACSHTDVCTTTRLWVMWIEALGREWFDTFLGLNCS